jgi:hypothetical protein
MSYSITARALYEWAQGRKYIAGGPWLMMDQSVRDRWEGFAQAIAQKSEEPLKGIMREYPGNDPENGPSLFRDLSPEEEPTFRRWAREHDTPELRVKASLFHPVVRDEWRRMDAGK